MTGREFLFEMCVGKFWDHDLSDEGNEFASFYYDGEGKYIADYAGALASGLPSVYHVADTWENYDKLVPVIDRRFSDWQHREQRRWWQVWRR